MRSQPIKQLLAAFCAAPLVVATLVTARPGLEAQSGVASPSAHVAATGEVASSRAAGEVEPGVASLRGEFDRLLANGRARDERWGVLVVSLDRGDTLYAHAPDAALVPASNMKLLTTAAALYYLGPQYRFSTYLVAHGPIRDGILDGDLIVYGTGDPTFSSRFGAPAAALHAFADSIVALGIREVRGQVVGDASYFAGPGVADGWQESYMNAAYAAPASALSFAENVATLEIRPGAQPGWRPEVRLVPGGDGIAIVNQATTAARGTRTSLHALRTAYDGPIIVRGRIAAGSGAVVRTVPLADSPRYVAAVLREALAQRGILVAGGVRAILRSDDSAVTGRTVFAPTYEQRTPLRVLAIHTSPPLIDVLDVVNRRSHNLLAEQTLRLVGRVAVGDGTIEGGGRAIRYMLERETGNPDPVLHVADGSGLSVLNRASARTFIRLLDYMARSPEWEAYWSTLPEAGQRNGLRRMHRTPAELNLRAKTGTISYVSALSGYVRAANGERLAFSIIANNVRSTWQAKRIEDAMGARIAAFDRRLAGSPDTSQRAGEARAAERTTTTPADPSARSYTIRPGDTLDAIARRHGTTVTALQQANPGVNPRRLRPGQTIRLP
jgi:serine-type D-Ala-D-Ala carboxypeptidase/endopeptidase (penicillin-binding protein 4)